MKDRCDERNVALRFQIQVVKAFPIHRLMAYSSISLQLRLLRVELISFAGVAEPATSPIADKLTTLW